MGIPGLKTFVQNNIRLKKVTSAHFNVLVVDGKSLISHITRTFRLTCTFGGQYPDLAIVLEGLFRTLWSNRIQVVVVFDGMDYEDQKRDTKLKRKKGSYSAIRKASCMANPRLNLRPLLAELVFCQVLRKLEIPFIFVDGDADQKIAQIANFYYCPVLAEDSDYFIFDLIAGYLPLDTFDWTAGSVSALLYERGSLVATAGFQSPDLVLGIPLLIGNDFCKPILRQSLEHASLSELGRGPAGKSIQLAVGLLSQFSSLADFISELPGQLDNPDVTSVQSSLSDGLDLIKCMYDATSSFITDPIDEMEASALMPQNDGKPVPKELLLFFRRGLANMTTLEALCRKYVDLPLCFEDLDQPSCDNIGEPLRATLYALLHLDWDEVEIKEQIRCHPYEDNLKLASVKVARSSVLPMVPRSCKTFKEICSLPVDTRKGIILHCLQVSPPSTAAIESLPPPYRLLAMITRYWYHNAVPKPKPQELRALILCLLTHGDSDDAVNYQRFDLKTTHICVQWQVVFKHIHDLNNLLSEPFPPLPPVSELLDGQLLHTLVQHISLIQHPENEVNGDLFYQLVSVASDEVCMGPKNRQTGANQQPISEDPSEQSAQLSQTLHSRHQTVSHRPVKQNPKASTPPTHSKRLTNASAMAHQRQCKQFCALLLCISLLILLLYILCINIPNPYMGA